MNRLLIFGAVASLIAWALLLWGVLSLINQIAERWLG